MAARVLYTIVQLVHILDYYQQLAPIIANNKHETHIKQDSKPTHNVI